MHEKNEFVLAFNFSGTLVDEFFGLAHNKFSSGNYEFKLLIKGKAYGQV